MDVQVLTHVRADHFFLELWTLYYGNMFGRGNLHIMIDGDDWDTHVDLSGINLHVVKDVPRERGDRNRFTASWQSRFAKKLLKSCPLVLRTDIDEFVCVDPASGVGLRQYLEALEPGSMKAAFGLDVIQGPDETPLIDDLPIFEQRRNAIITREFCKLVAVSKPLRWVGGFHRARNVDVDISSALVLFHLALVDRKIAAERIAERKSVPEHPTLGAHIEKRLDRFSELADTSPLSYDDTFNRALEQLMKTSPSRTGPHVGFIRDGNVTRGYHVRIPDRFVEVLPSLEALKHVRMRVASTAR